MIFIKTLFVGVDNKKSKKLKKNQICRSKRNLQNLPILTGEVLKLDALVILLLI